MTTAKIPPGRALTCVLCALLASCSRGGAAEGAPGRDLGRPGAPADLAFLGDLAPRSPIRSATDLAPPIQYPAGPLSSCTGSGPIDRAWPSQRPEGLARSTSFDKGKRSMSIQRRAVLYARVSTDRGEQNPEAQLVALRKWMSDRGWPIVAEHTDLVTCDPKRRRRDPPGLVKAIRLIEDRKANVLVIFAADRLVADPIPLINLVARVQDMGGDVCSYEDGRELDTTCEESLFTIFMRGMFNRWRLKLNRRASIAGQQRARLEGRLPGRPRIDLPRERVEQAREELRAEGKPCGWRPIAKRLGVSTTTVRRTMGVTGKSAPVVSRVPAQ